jgi:hypothetical protein
MQCPNRNSIAEAISKFSSPCAIACGVALIYSRYRHPLNVTTIYFPFLLGFSEEPHVREKPAKLCELAANIFSFTHACDHLVPFKAFDGKPCLTFCKNKQTLLSWACM